MIHNIVNHKVMNHNLYENGEYEAKCAVAQRMLEKGLEANFISELTGLSVSVIENLAKEFNAS